MTVNQRIEFKRPGRFFIGGEWVAPASDKQITVLSAHNEEVFATFPEAQAQDVERAVAAAKAAFEGPWQRTTPAERGALLGAMAGKLMERSPDLAHAWTNQMGILHQMASFGAPGMAGTFAYYAGLAQTFPFEEVHEPSYGGGTGLLVREAVGVVAAIVPWNAPASLIAYKVAPAILAGCTVVLKASPEAPSEAFILAEIAEEVGLPAGVLNVIVADREVSELLVRHPNVDKVSFTGSTAAGKRIASICGERIARCTLELGGKSAAVILNDFPVEDAAAGLAGSITLMSGQVCAALTRIIVPQQRHDQLVEALAANFKAIKTGDPYEAGVGLGPLAVKRQLDRVLGYIEKGKAEGAQLVTGGGRPPELNRGWFVEPTLFAKVENTATIAREEIFGPVLSVISAKDEEDAINIANDSNFGLNNSVFTNDVDRAYQVARRLRSGTVGQNGFRTDFNIAFGGFKQSGLGREGGREGLLPYLEAKTILLSQDPSHVKR